MSFHLLKGHDFQRAQGRHSGCWLEMKKRSSSCAWAYRDCSIKLAGVMWLSAALVMTDIPKHNGIGLTELKVHSDNKAWLFGIGRAILMRSNGSLVLLNP